MLRIFIGYDPRETVAYHVAAHSIMRHASQPVSICPLMLSQLPLTRPREGSTEFSFSRFLVPWLCGYTGQALFMDCDVLVRGDVAELFRDDDYSLRVVKHDYTPRDSVKFLGNRQLRYDRKNWSSVMLFRNDACRALSLHVVDTMSGLWLHQFKWLKDREVGGLPHEWNHLVGEMPTRPSAKLAHFTCGGPWFPEYASCEFANEWREERDLMLGAARA